MGFNVNSELDQILEVLGEPTIFLKIETLSFTRNSKCVYHILGGRAHEKSGGVSVSNDVFFFFLRVYEHAKRKG